MLGQEMFKIVIFGQILHQNGPGEPPVSSIGLSKLSDMIRKDLICCSMVFYWREKVLSDVLNNEIVQNSDFWSNFAPKRPQ